MSSDSTDPMEATRQRLSEIAQLWIDHARKKATPYVEKLPAPVRQQVNERILGVHAEAEAGPADAPAQ